MRLVRSMRRILLHAFAIRAVQPGWAALGEPHTRICGDPRVGRGPSLVLIGSLGPLSQRWFGSRSFGLSAAEAVHRVGVTA